MGDFPDRNHNGPSNIHEQTRKGASGSSVGIPINAAGAVFRNTRCPGMGLRYRRRRMHEQIILEVVTDLLRLRVRREIIASAALSDRAVVILRDVGRSYARRRKFRFVDMTKN
jgi:hypothetical protein